MSDPDTVERWECGGIMNCYRCAALEKREVVPAAALEWAEERLRREQRAADAESDELTRQMHQACRRAERAEAEAREWKRDFESALARNVGNGWYRLADGDRRMLLTALGDVWRIQSDDEPNPHAATLLFRRLSTTERDGNE